MGEAEISWGCATRTCPGETVIGDIAVVRRLPAGALVGALDGTGHGPQAAHAAVTAAAVVRRLAGAPPASVLVGCHEALRSTRGAAISLAMVSTARSTVSWVAVGNVVGVVVTGADAGGRRRWLRSPGGVAGHALPDPRPDEFSLHHGDVVVLATDGVDGAFADDLDLAGRPEAIAERVIDRHWIGTDDGLVLVVRVIGAAG